MAIANLIGALGSLAPALGGGPEANQSGPATSGVGNITFGTRNFGTNAGASVPAGAISLPGWVWVASLAALAALGLLLVPSRRPRKKGKA